MTPAVSPALISVVELRPNGPQHFIRSVNHDWPVTRCGLGVSPLDLVAYVDPTDVDSPCKRCLTAKNHP